VIHCKAKDMQADGFSKPYEPAKQGPFSTLILGKDVNKIDRWALQIRTSEEMQIRTSEQFYARV